MLSTPYKQVLSWVVEHYAEAIHNVQRQKNMSTSDLAKMVRIDEWTMEDMYVARGFYLYQDWVGSKSRMNMKRNVYTMRCTWPLKRGFFVDLLEAILKRAVRLYLTAKVRTITPDNSTISRRA